MRIPFRRPGGSARALILGLVATFRLAGPAAAQQGAVVEAAVDCPSLEGNLVGDQIGRAHV